MSAYKARDALSGSQEKILSLFWPNCSDFLYVVLLCFIKDQLENFFCDAKFVHSGRPKLRSDGR